MPSDSLPESKYQRARQLFVRGQQRAQQLAHDVEASRDRVSAIDIAFAAAERDRTAGGALLAGALAFRTFLWMLPAALLSVLVLGLASSTSGTDPEELVKDSGFPALAASSVASAAGQDDRGRILAILATVLFLWLASGTLLKVLRAVHAFAWHQELRRPASAFKSTGAFLVFALGAVVLLSAISSLRRSEPGLGLGLLLLLGLAFAAVWWFASWHLPHGAASPLELLPGAVLMGVAMQGIHVFVVLYLAHKVASMSELYGNLGGAAAILLGLYIFSRVVVAAAMLNAAMWARRRARAATEPAVAAPAPDGSTRAG
jgi:uncharacterized BrkB/YihY/UPF0761 family membrane protein